MAKDTLSESVVTSSYLRLVAPTERTALTRAVDGVTHLDITAALSTFGEAITRALRDTALSQH